MKRIFTLAFILLFASCTEERDSAFFSPDGVRLGPTEAVGPDVVFVPIEFETEIVHSGQWLYDVKHQVNGREIWITAIFATQPNAPESKYGGGITLRNLDPGEYSLRYRDTDGSLHDIGMITVPN